MIRGKRKTLDPCLECGLHKTLCICAHIPRLKLKTKVSLIIHAKELKRTTNTGRLAIKALENSEMFIRGEGKAPLDLTPLLMGPNYRTLLFYPSSDAIELTPQLVHKSALPIQLIVPDGNWRQAGKVHTRHPELKELPRVMIKTENKAQFHLRKEHSKEGMATLEAIAHALGIIEGEAAGGPLLDLYQKKLSQTLKGRGLAPDLLVTV